MASVKDNFTRSLFDDQWLLLGFEDILKDLEESILKQRKNDENSERIPFSSRPANCETLFTR